MRSALYSYLVCFAIIAIYGIDDDIKNYCSNDCKTRPHTLCLGSQHKLQPRCASNEIDKMNIKRLLINGHNGLRDRIAFHVNISNMVYLAWSNILEQMADFYMNYCTPYTNDECTELLPPKTKNDYLHYNIETDADFTYIAQNRFCKQSEYYPLDFIEEAMRTWYYENENLPKPIYITNPHDTTYGMFLGENNFTHLAFPLIAHIGCSLRSYKKHYCVICNYYPYYRFSNKSIFFRSGMPAAACPAFHPLRHEFFTGLCTSKLYDDVNYAQQLRICHIIIFICILVLLRLIY